MLRRFDDSVRMRQERARKANNLVAAAYYAEFLDSTAVWSLEEENLDFYPEATSGYLLGQAIDEYVTAVRDRNALAAKSAWESVEELMLDGEFLSTKIPGT